MLKKRIIIFIISFLLIFSLVPIFNSTGENKNSPVKSTVLSGDDNIASSTLDVFNLSIAGKSVSSIIFN